MTTQVIFKIDKKLKDKAMKRAQKEGVPLASVLKLATQAYANGDLDMGLIVHEPFNARTRRAMDSITKDVLKGKNLSPEFTNADDIITYLKKK